MLLPAGEQAGEFSGALHVAMRQTTTMPRDIIPKEHSRKRRFARVKLPKGMLVAWQFANHRGVSRVATLGLGGLYISTPEPPPVGTLLKLLFDVPDGEVRARATVRNATAGEGMAVAFVDMESADRARLTQLLKKLA